MTQSLTSKFWTSLTVAFGTAGLSWNINTSALADIFKGTPFMQRKQWSKATKDPVKEYVLTPPDSYYPIEGLLSGIRGCIEESVGGVACFSAPEGFGKSTALKKIANQMLEEKRIAGVVEVSVNDKQLLSEAIAETIGVSNDWYCNQDLLPVLQKNFLPPAPGDAIPQYLIIVDSCDAFVAGARDAHPASRGRDSAAGADVVRLAEHSMSLKTFRIILVTKDTLNARNVHSWNGGTKIRAYPCQGDAESVLPTEDEMDKMVAKQNLPSTLPKDVTDEFKRLARRARRPSFVVDGSEKFRGSPADKVITQLKKQAEAYELGREMWIKQVDEMSEV